MENGKIDHDGKTIGLGVSECEEGWWLRVGHLAFTMMLKLNAGAGI
jgi:hypothetical protein